MIKEANFYNYNFIAKMLTIPESPCPFHVNIVCKNIETVEKFYNFFKEKGIDKWNKGSTHYRCNSNNGNVLNIFVYDYAYSRCRRTNMVIIDSSLPFIDMIEIIIPQNNFNPNFGNFTFTEAYLNKKLK